MLAQANIATLITLAVLIASVKLVKQPLVPKATLHLVRATYKPHPEFKRTGQELYYEAKIDIVTALFGGVFQITHLDDRVFTKWHYSSW